MTETTVNEAEAPAPAPSQSLTIKPRRLAGSEYCLNCSTKLQGPFCHFCGQPDKRLLRFFPVLIREFFEDFLELDTRFSRTMLPLLFKPGRLTRDYLDGRRFRYTPPMRLLIFSSMLFFILAATLASNAIELNPGAVKFDGDGVYVAPSIEELEGIEGLTDEQREMVARALENHAEGLQQMQQEEAAQAEDAEAPSSDADSVEESAAPADDPPQGIGEQIAAEIAADIEAERNRDDDDFTVNFNGEDWDRETNPLLIPLMPDSFNDWINDEIENSPQKAEQIQENPNIIVDKIFELLPATMFIMLPIVALLFKFWYLFARKYYVEHLIHALHNHAFLFVALTITLLINALIDWRDPQGTNAVWQVLVLLNVAIFLWMPVYLLVSLRVVYRQNWFLTVAKYLVIGMCYMFLLTVLTTVVALLSFLLL